MRVIYETKGKAREYCELACNLYHGCSHGCRYCYNRILTGKFRRPDFDKPDIRYDNFIADVEHDAWRKQHADDKRPVFLCFTCDPYQPLDIKHRLTRQAIEVLHKYDSPVMILTKGGLLACRDFDLLGKQDRFGVTLTLHHAADLCVWEPQASGLRDRILSLYYAHDKGIPTWVSLEPIIDPEQTCIIIRETYTYVDHYKVGKMNHDTGINVKWAQAIPKIKATLDNYGCNYYIKKDTEKYL